MTLAHDRNLQTGIAGSVAIHALLLLLVTWGISTHTARNLANTPQDAPKPKEPEVTLIFPEQILVEPPKPVRATEIFIKTSQNQAVAEAPKNATFKSDRNTRAASILPPTTSSPLAMPTLNGTSPGQPELTSNDYQEGRLRDNARQNAPGKTPPASLPEPKAPTATLDALKQQMEVENTKDQTALLPLEVRKPAPREEPPAAKPQVRMPEDTPPPLMTNPSDEADFNAFTQTSKKEGSVSTEGENAVDAEATPQAVYESKVKTAILQRWQASVNSSTLSGTGRVRFSFYVDKKGVPQDLTIHSDSRDADPRMRELTLKAILDAEIPPLPADLLPTLEGGRLKIEYEAIIY